MSDEFDDEPASLSVYECASLKHFQTFESPNVYIRNEFLQTEMTVLGWAVYFGASNFDECKEVIKFAATIPSCDPFLPMRDGFFHGKRVREIAEYYQRREIVLQLEKLEKAFEEKRNETHEIVPEQEKRQGRGFQTVSMSLRTISVPSFKRQSIVKLPKTSSSTTDRNLEREVLDYLEMVGIPLDDQVLVCRLLMESQFNTMRAIANGKKTDFVSIGLSPAYAQKLVDHQKYISNAASPQSPAPKVPVLSNREAESIDPDAEAFHARVRELNQESRKEDDALFDSVVEEEDVLPPPPIDDSPAREDMSPPPKQDTPPPAREDTPPPAKQDTPPPAESPVPAPVPKATRSVRFETVSNVWKPLPNNKRFHFYLSFSNGKYQQDKLRMHALTRALTHHGFLSWLPENELEDDIEADCKRGIEASCVFLALVTPAYESKVKAKQVWNGFEFGFAQDSNLPMVSVSFDREFTSRLFSECIQLSSDLDVGVNELIELGQQQAWF